MAVIVNGQRFLEAADVQGNPSLANQEANRQLNFAESELTRRRSETLVDEDGTPNPNGAFINAQLSINLKTSIASQLPAITVALRTDAVSFGTFAISEDWPHRGEAAVSSGTPPAPQPDSDVITPDNQQDRPATTTPGGDLSAEESARVQGRDPGAGGSDAEDSDFDFGDIEPGAGTSAGEAAESVTPGTVSGSPDPKVAASTTAPVVTQAQGNTKDIRSGTTGAELTADIENIEINPQTNQLSDFASYTYNFELLMLSPRRYVDLLQAPGDVNRILSNFSVPIVRSGGIASDGPEQFDIDFFIDNLKLNNLATAPSTRAVNTNATELTFQITEPNGVTLLERLKDAAKTMLEENENYISTPYVLKITFKGYDDTGAEIIGAIKPKHIPIKINDITFSITESGAVYKCSAIPFNHSVFSSISSTIPVNVQVSAGTVKDVFQGAASIEDKTVTESKRVVAGTGELGDGDIEDEQFKTVTMTKNIFGEPHTTLQAAMNDFYKKKTQPTTDKKTGKTIPSTSKIADEVSFKFAPEIGNAKVQSEKFDALNTPQANQKAYKTIAGAVKGKVTVDKKNNLFKINNGTNITALINYVIVASNYLDSNINEEPQNQEKKEKIRWFKIIPQITKFLGWDDKDSRYKFHVQYTVIVNGQFYQDFPWAAKTKPKGQGVHKIYDYIFSGNNTEVQTFRLDFDTAYYQARTLGTGTPDRDLKNIEDVHTQMKDVPSQNQNIVNDESVTAKRKKDLFGTIMHDGYDLVQIEMDILGDPAFFPTGDAMFQPQGNNNKVYNEPFLPDGTINYDLTPPYIQVNLKTPTDYNPVTGLMDLSTESKYSSSQFNGVYRVTQTTSNFSGGVFTQTLSALREKMQPVNGKVGRSTTSIQNQERQDAVDQFSNIMFQIMSAGRNPFAALARSGATSLSQLAQDFTNNLQAERIQAEADRTDQGQFEEGIGDEIPEEAPVITFNRVNNTDILEA